MVFTCKFEVITSECISLPLRQSMLTLKVEYFRAVTLSLLLVLLKLFFVVMIVGAVEFSKRRCLINGPAQSSSTVRIDLLAITSDQHGLILVETVLEMSHTMEADISDGYPSDAEWSR